MKLPQIIRKTLLYKSGVENAGYALNHVEGCAHGCRYPCYAMLIKKRCGAVKSYEDWIHPKIVGNALKLLGKELPRRKNKISSVFLCFATDPFMYHVEEVQNLTLEILQRLNKEGIKAVLLSKGVYPNTVLDTSAFSNQNEYGATIVSLSEDFRKKFEPHAATVEQRVKSLKKLHEAGLKTWVMMEPYPTPNIIKQDIRDILSQISFVDRIIFGSWNYSALPNRFAHYKEFYNSMAYEVAKFCAKKSIDVHIKEDTLNLSMRKASFATTQ
jgi:DNA repair photolyase